jgi:chromosome segregation ATPase
MVSSRGAWLAALLGCAAAVKDSPVAKVVELLQESKMKVKTDLDAESKEMAEYSEFCDSEISEKTYSIKTSTRKLAELNAAILEATAQVSSLDDSIATIGSQMAEKEAQLIAATDERTKEKADFKATEGELVTSVDQLNRAITMIKRGTSFVQGVAKVPRKDLKLALSMISRVLDASWVNAATRRSLKGLLQTGVDAEDGADLSLKQPQPTVSAYESHSGDIVSQISDMKEKAEETLSSARNGEMKEQHNFDMMSQSLHDAISLFKEKLSTSKSQRAAAAEALGKAKKDSTETQTSKTADEGALASVSSECKQAAADWEDRQASAKGEMAAIEKAKAILTAGVRVFMIQEGAKQPGAADEDSQNDAIRRRVLTKLKQLNHHFSSYALMSIVSSAGSDPFVKVKGLISDMVAKLVLEANEDATQKGFCDEEMSKSKVTQEDKSMTLDKLQSRLDKAATSKAQLEQSVKELLDEVAALDKGSVEATKIRNEEHETYLKASKDFSDAAKAVQGAIGVLKEYYSGSGASLIQTNKKAPAFGGAKTDTATTIISILEGCSENFVKLHMQVETEETMAANAYKKFTSETRTSKASKQAQVKAEHSEIKSLDVALKNSKEDFGMTSKELDAVMAYIEKLKPQCEVKVQTYAEKKAAREAEIEGLKEALGILDGASLIQAGNLRAIRRI